jgi:hypothetical protein
LVAFLQRETDFTKFHKRPNSGLWFAVIRHFRSKKIGFIFLRCSKNPVVIFKFLDEKPLLLKTFKLF